LIRNVKMKTQKRQENDLNNYGYLLFFLFICLIRELNSFIMLILLVIWMFK